MDQQHDPSAFDDQLPAIPSDTGLNGYAPPESRRVARSEQSRHDAFTGEQMARFCEVLAETGVVTTAARVVGKNRDTVYEHRRRNPLFAAAWAAALSHARNRLADLLLERSIEGSIDYIYRDGDRMGERHYIDNRLAYAMLRRLDKQAEADPQPVAAELARQAEKIPATPHPERREADWSTALTALRSGSEEDLCAALALLAPETDKTDNPPNPENDPVGFAPDPAGERVWEEGDRWRTNFPPPPGFDGDEDGEWNDDAYERDCTPAEEALLNRIRDRELAELRAEEETERDAFFTQLRAEITGEEECASRSGA